jgi:hypothetical protein
MPDLCEVCNTEAPFAYRVSRGVDPVPDDKGDLWRAWEPVSGPHFRCWDHRATEDEMLIHQDQGDSIQ